MNQNITDKKLIEEHLSRKYGLIVDEITKGPRGFVAETYIIESENGKYFVKMVKKGRYDHNLVKSVEVQSKLFEVGLRRIPHPIRSNTGKSATELAGYTFVLFNFVKGEWIRNYKDGEVLDVIIDLHKIDPNTIPNVEQEDFGLPYAAELTEILTRVFRYNSSGELEIRTRNYLKGFKKEIYNDWENFSKLIEKCRASNFDFHITHEDPWSNVMRSEDGGVYLFDWDDITLAPVERDLWFKLGSVDVLNYYKKSFPEYQINKLAYDFYLYNRYFYDLYGFLVEIFSDNTKEHKEENYQLLIIDWTNWLRNTVRKQVGKY